MTSFRLFLWKSKNEWLVWSLAKTVPPPLHWTLPTSRPFWAVNCANEQLWSRAEIVPMFRHNSSVKWTILSSHPVLHTIDMYTRIGGVSLLNQTIPTNFSIISTLNWWSVSMRGVFLSTTRVLFLAPFQLENRLAPSFVYLWHTLNIYWRAVGVFLTSKSALTVGKPR